MLEKTSSTSDLYTIEVDAPMEDSAIMMWASIHDIGHSETFLWYAHSMGGESKYTKYLKVRDDKKVTASFFQDNYVVESKSPLKEATWTHIAMSVNKPLGLSIFVKRQQG